MNTPRDTAEAIIRLRRLLVRSLVRQMAANDDDDLEQEFAFVVRSLPWPLRTDRALLRYVVEPARRRARALGIPGEWIDQ